MTVRSIAHRALQSAIAPALAFALFTGVAQAVPQHHDDHHDNDRGRDFRFREEDRGHFAPHYQRDVDHWRNAPHRPHFERGEHIPPSYRFQPVPRAYYSEVPPPPPGYQYGYYQGYVVVYNPTTRIVADVLDLAAAAAR
jgi:Ni/Co efflux regulator RcnB